LRVVLDHAPSTGVAIPDDGTAKFLRVGRTGGAHRRIKIVWGRQGDGGRYQGNDDGDISQCDHHQLRYLPDCGSHLARRWAGQNAFSLSRRFSHAIES
jgi:hypothetical protein